MSSRYRLLLQAAGLVGAALVGAGLALGVAALFGGFGGETTTVREVVSTPSSAPAAFRARA